MAAKLPFFLFDIDDFVTSPIVQNMSPAAVGVYILLLCHQWRNGVVPADERGLRLASRSIVGSAWEEFAPFLDDCFPVAEGGERMNPRMASERLRVLDKSMKRAESGRKGGQNRAAKQSQAIAKQTIANASKGQNTGPESAPEAPKTPSKTVAIAKQNEPSTHVCQANASDSQAIAKQIQADKEEELYSSPPSPKGESPPHLELVTWLWFELEETRSDPVAEIARRIRQARHYESVEPKREEIERLLEAVSGYADADQVLEVVDAFKDHAERKRKAEYKDPVKTIRTWVTRDEARLRQVRRQREIDAERAQRSSKQEASSRWAMNLN